MAIIEFAAAVVLHSEYKLIYEDKCQYVSVGEGPKSQAVHCRKQHCMMASEKL